MLNALSGERTDFSVQLISWSYSPGSDRIENIAPTALLSLGVNSLHRNCSLV
jgi:hypothetical protein